MRGKENKTFFFFSLFFFRKIKLFLDLSDFFLCVFSPNPQNKKEGEKLKKFISCCYLRLIEFNQVTTNGKFYLFLLARWAHLVTNVVLAMELNGLRELGNISNRKLMDRALNSLL